MKTLLCLCAGLSFLALGCGDSSNSKTPATNNVSSGNPLTAPVDYLGALGEAKKKMEKTLDVVQINHAIEQFMEQENRNPRDLNELIQKGFLHEIPKAPYGSKIEYDAANGTVKVVKQ